MIKVYINDEEVLCDKNIVIKKEMLNTSSTILNNVYPKSWETTHDYTTNYYYPLDYSNCKITDIRDIPAEEGQTIEGTNFNIDVDLSKEYSFDDFKGNTTQNGTPTPDNPVNVNVVTGEQEIEVTNGTETQTYKINLGKNLFDKNNANVISGYFRDSANQLVINSNSENKVVIFEGEPNTTYTITKTLSNRFRIGIYDTMLSDDGTYTFSNPIIRDDSATTLSITTTDTNYYIYIHIFETGNLQATLDTIRIIDNSQMIELCKIGDYQDRIYKDNGKWYKYRAIYKMQLDGSQGTESWNSWGVARRKNGLIRFRRQNWLYNISFGVISTHFIGSNLSGTDDASMDNNTIYAYNKGLSIVLNESEYPTVDNLLAMLEEKKPIVYYVLETPTTTEITDTELINQLESIELIEGINNISSNGNLPIIMNLHYNYVTHRIDTTLLFSGIVKNTGNISLNPREPHYTSIEVLGYETFLSESDTLDFVIADKTIQEAIEMVIEAVSSYGITLGSVNIKNPNDIIGAYSCEDKTAYDVLQYLAEISEARWKTTIVDEDTIQVDFYDPDLESSSATIEYTQRYFANNNIIDMEYNYGTRDYRNKQVINSNAVYADILTTETIYSDGYNTSYNLENRVGTISSVTINGVTATFVTREEYDAGYSGDLIYEYGSNTITLETLQSAATPIVINYTAIVKGRETVTNDTEISRINSQLNVNGIISRYEDRDDITSSDELLKIANTYMKYKGATEITLTIQNRDKDLFDIGQVVTFDNAPLEKLQTTYIVKAKEIDYIVTANCLFYTYTLTSNFNSENAINYFDNQRNKRNGNIATGSFIDRNIDLFSSANIIWQNASLEEVEVVGDNRLNSTLNSPFVV